MKTHPENVPGKYYVDGEGCCEFGLCIDAAPNNFRFGSSETSVMGAFVFKQPETLEEAQECERAIEVCPMAVIYDDGAPVPAR